MSLPWHNEYLLWTWHLGTRFAMSIKNCAYPSFSFNSITIREEAPEVFCQVPDADLIAALKATFNTTWTIGSNNYFEDSHIAGNIVFDLFDRGNTSITVCQIFRLTSGRWFGVNPTHAIGAQGGFLGGLNAVHYVTYTRESATPTFVRVTKDSKTCADTP